MTQFCAVVMWIEEVNSCPESYGFNKQVWSVVSKILCRPSAMWMLVRGSGVSWTTHAELTTSDANLLIKCCRNEWSTDFINKVGIYFNDSKKKGESKQASIFYNCGVPPPVVNVGHERGAVVGAVLSGRATKTDKMEAAPVLVLEVPPAFGAGTGGDAVAVALESRRHQEGLPARAAEGDRGAHGR